MELGPETNSGEASAWRRPPRATGRRGRWRSCTLMSKQQTGTQGGPTLLVSSVEMLSRLFCSWTWLVLGLSLAVAQPTPDLAQILSRISASVINGPSTELLRQLTDDIGARLVGSPAYERAAQWAAARFREAGLTNVRFEEFTLPNSWQRGPAHARILAPVTRSLRVGSVGWGPSTPPGGIRGDLILVSDLSPVTLRLQSAQLKNRIVLVDLERALPSDEPLAFARLRDSYAMLSDLGVQAVLLPHDVPNNVEGWVDTGNARGTILPLPVGDIGWEDHLLLRRHLTRGRVMIEADWQNEISGPMQVSNVVAEIAGSELSPSGCFSVRTSTRGISGRAHKTMEREWSWSSRPHAPSLRWAERRDDRFGSPSGPQRSPGHRARRCLSSGTQPSCAIAWLS